jgi:hypothetical protein
MGELVDELEELTLPVQSMQPRSAKARGDVNDMTRGIDEKSTFQRQRHTQT